MGWRQHFQGQLTLAELTTLVPARVAAVHRTDMLLWTEQGELRMPLGGRWFQGDADDRPTVGDWVLLAPDLTRIERLLERQSVFRRLAPGGRGEVQLIAANVDTLFVVSSCNDEFNPARIERYVTLANDAGVDAVLVLTKADAAADPDAWVERARASVGVDAVVAINGLDHDTVAPLADWCGPGRTVALVGSSGVGKSTLVNALAGRELAATGAIRDADAKGRHTTTHRALHLLDEGGILLDSPGMREIQLADVEQGVSETFDDIDALARTCRFNDCAHAREPGCAVRAAIEAGELASERLARYEKLLREQAFGTETIAERRARTRQFNKVVQRAMATKNAKLDRGE